MGKDAILDRGAAMARLGNDEQFYHSVCRGFIDYAEEKLDAMRRAAASGQLDELERQAHSLKSSSASVGGMDCRQRARLLEEASRGGSLVEAQKALTELEESLAILIQALRECERGD